VEGDLKEMEALVDDHKRKSPFSKEKGGFFNFQFST